MVGALGPCQSKLCLPEGNRSSHCSLFDLRGTTSAAVLYSHCCPEGDLPAALCSFGPQKWLPGTCDLSVQRSGFRQLRLTFPSLMQRTKLTLSRGCGDCAALKVFLGFFSVLCLQVPVKVTKCFICMQHTSIKLKII